MKEKFLQEVKALGFNVLEKNDGKCLIENFNIKESTWSILEIELGKWLINIDNIPSAISNTEMVLKILEISSNNKNRN